MNDLSLEKKVAILLGGLRSGFDSELCGMLVSLLELETLSSSSVAIFGVTV